MTNLERVKAMFRRALNERIKSWYQNESWNILRTHADIMREAKRYGKITVVRYDRDQGKVVVEEVTDSMPASEVVT